MNSLEYRVYQTSDGAWTAMHTSSGQILGRRPKKEPAKRLAQQHAGRRVLEWKWDADTKTYTSL